MTHLHTTLPLPERAPPSPMEDAIVQQVEWYMGRLNLEKDEYLKHQMDEHLWVSLDVILNFPKMQRMGVHDKRRVATLLHARSTIVEVDEKAARIRPAWARRSTIVIHDVPASARLDQVANLFQIPSNADLSNPAPVPPAVSHPPGLISIQPAAETIWLAIFDSPTGAQESLHLLLDKEVNGRKVTPEVHVENALRPQADAFRQPEGQPQQPVYQIPADSPQPNSAHYAPVNPIMSTGMMTNQMLNPMGMPMPVMHHPTQEMHPQYSYGPAATTAPGYPPHNMAVPRQFMGAPRGMHAGYVMAYPQAGHPYDASHAVPLQAHPIQAQQQQQQQVDQNGTPIIPSASMSSEGATTSTQGVQNVAAPIPNGATPTPAAPTEAVEGVEASAEFVQEGALAQVQADAQTIAGQIPFTGPMQVPVITGQPIEGQMMMAGQGKTVDVHYMQRTQIMSGDQNTYGRGNGRQQGMGRDRNGQRNPDGSMRTPGRGSMMDGQRGSTMHRKGKKGNRGGTRHGHGHDRERRDGKGDGSGSDTGNRDDRKTEKPKPEPNLASMHFPPLPMSDISGARGPQSKVVKKDVTENKAATLAPDAKDVVPNGSEAAAATETTKTEPARLDGESGAPTTDGKEKGSPVEAPTKVNADWTNDETSTAAPETGESKEVSSSAVPEKAPESKVTPTGPSPMSYAAILRSKKPGPPPRPPPPAPVSRSSSETSGKNGDSNSGTESNTAAPPHPAKEKSSRRRKSNNQRNGHNGEAKDGSNVSNGGQKEKNANKNSNGAAAVNEVKDPSPSGSENARSKPVVENTRAHPVWVNKPKSLFQAASAAPTARPSTPQVPIDSKKVSSPVSSQGDEKDVPVEKALKDVIDQTAPNGQANGVLTTGKEEASDINANGAVETKEVPEGTTTKVVHTASKASTEGAKNGKGTKTADKTSNLSARGAWAAGGPKAWPKNSGNGVMEKPSNTTES